MEKKDAIWVVVTWDSESVMLTSQASFTNREDAEKDVYNWYTCSEADEDVEYAQIYDDKLFACCNINGRDEFCEAFEVEL